MEKSTFTREYKLFCQLLRAAREKAGVTQVVLAEHLRESQSEISKFERGERRLDPVQLHLWCQAIGIRASDLIRSFEEKLPVKRK